MYILFLFAFVFMLFCFPCLRCFLLNPFKTFFYSIKDLFYFYKHKEYWNVPTGKLVCFTGLFGKGKTLSDVHEVSHNLFERYNNKPIWCRERKKFVTQKIVVLSNVQLKIPYIEFTSLSQIVSMCNQYRKIDFENNTFTKIIVLGDEFSVQLNSRNFKSNINPLFLNTLLTCRHYHLSIYYTSQRFQHVDALLRQVTSYVIDCNKLWRFQRLNYYDAWELENATSVKMVQPYKRSAWFVRDKDFNAYDTLATVNNLERSFNENDMLSEKEILELQNNLPNNENVLRKRKKYRKKQ